MRRTAIDRRTRINRRRPELSQHFLRDAAVARAFVRRLPLAPGDLVVEAGAGDGVLTDALCEAGCRVVAVEKDERLYRMLRARLAGRPDVVCYRADFLPFRLPAEPYAVVSNVPYGITAGLVRKLLRAARPPDDAYLIVQREAAAKFAGMPRETMFSLSHKPWFAMTVGRGLRRGDFVPVPRVESALLHIHRRGQPLVEAASARAYRAFIRAGFVYGSTDVSRALRRRLTARQVARLGRDAGFSPHARASQLTFEQWLAVFRFVEHLCLGRDPTPLAA